MASNSSSVVISFSIAILLLLILLLLLSYNSKNKRDNNEHFYNPDIISGMKNVGNPMNNFMNSMDSFNFNNDRSDKFTNNPSSVATEDPYAKSSVMTDNNNPSNIMTPNDNYECNYTYLNGGEGDKTKFSSIKEGFETKVTEPTSCLIKEKLTSQDLLPKDAANLKWANINPSSQANIEDQNFLTAGYHIGVNTVGQSLRNANLQLRSEIPNPQVAVSPWLISTIEPDLRAATLEIGSAPSY